jgi:hypothetical protein
MDHHAYRHDWQRSSNVPQSETITALTEHPDINKHSKNPKRSYDVSNRVKDIRTQEACFGKGADMALTRRFARRPRHLPNSARSPTNKSDCAYKHHGSRRGRQSIFAWYYQMLRALIVLVNGMAGFGIEGDTFFFRTQTRRVCAHSRLACPQFKK